MNNDIEIWKPIVSFERYDVSNMGNIRRGSKIIKPCLDTYGYRQVNLYINGSRYTRKVYRLVLSTFCPNHENKPQIDHINRIRTDDRLENLRWATSSENCRNKTGYIEEMHGINWNVKNSSYVVKFIKDGTEQYFGSRKTLSEAIELRDLSMKVNTYTKIKLREMYGISKSSKNKYRVRIGKSGSSYVCSLEEAKIIRDKLLNNQNENNIV
jgi:hypothetical protein